MPTEEGFEIYDRYREEGRLLEVTTDLESYVKERWAEKLAQHSAITEQMRRERRENAHLLPPDFDFEI